MERNPNFFIKKMFYLQVHSSLVAKRVGLADVWNLFLVFGRWRKSAYIVCRLES